MRRRSKLKASDFLRMVLFDHLQHSIPSLQQHALGIYDESGQKISKQAIDKRFNEGAQLFIQRLFEQMLSRQVSTGHLNSHLSRQFKSVKVLDSTEFKLPEHFAGTFVGYGSRSAAACAAVQLEYDVLSRKIHWLSLSNARESDKTFADRHMDSIEAGDLILRDLGYYNIDSYLKIEQRQAFYISRLKPQIAIYQKVSEDIYKPLSWSTILQRIKKSGNSCFDQGVYIGKEQKHAVRLMAWIIPENEQQKRLRKKKNRKGMISREDKIWSKLNVFITNITSDTMEAQQVYCLYKIRWQIEWMFKIWKSILNIDVVRKMKTSRLKCYLYSKLTWVLVCWDITGIAEQASWKEEGKLISPYKSFAILTAKAGECRNMLFSGGKMLSSWLTKIVEILVMYGGKETKNKKVQLSELLQLKQRKKR